MSWKILLKIFGKQNSCWLINLKHLRVTHTIFQYFINANVEIIVTHNATFHIGYNKKCPFQFKSE